MLESIKNWWEKARRARETRKAYEALNSFSDRQLLDIGLTRAEIYAKVFDVTKIRESGWLSTQLKIILNQKCERT